MTIPLRSVELEDDAPRTGFPWDLPVIRHLDRISFDKPVTFFAGENGTGKSTLLEAIAMEIGLNPEGGTKSLRFSAAPTESTLHNHLRLAWNRRAQRSFFLRAESFFNMATAYHEVGTGAPGDPMAELHERSHGEQFLDVVRQRFGPGGLFLMDEPEAALSFTSQLALMRVMHELSEAGSQFIIATHSPVLLSFPGADILLLAEGPIDRVSRDEAPQVPDVRDFLNAPGAYFHHLFAD